MQETADMGPVVALTGAAAERLFRCTGLTADTEQPTHVQKSCVAERSKLKSN